MLYIFEASQVTYLQSLKFSNVQICASSVNHSVFYKFKQITFFDILIVILMAEFCEVILPRKQRKVMMD